MRIKSIKLKNFKNFDSFEIEFATINLVQGKNGSGKTTIAGDAVYFSLYGYTAKDLISDLPTRGKSKSCAVTINLLAKSHEYEITREFPLKLTIKEDGKILDLSTSEGNKYIIDLVGTRENFFRFRIVDAYSSDANFLESGQTTLKKIIFSGSDELFNKVRENISALKFERDRLNRDKINISHYYPSEKRLKILTEALKNIEPDYTQALSETRTLQKEESTDLQKRSQAEYQIKEAQKKLLKLSESQKCYICNSELETANKARLIADLDSQIANNGAIIEQIGYNLEFLADIIVESKKKEEKLRIVERRISARKILLEARLKVKEYIYTDKDVIIMKKALEELDKISSTYLVETVKTLEPIINSIISRVNFKITFEVDAKGKFNLSLEKNDIKYKYKDLSCGEKLVLQIAFKLAILLQRNETGVVIADEGLGALDEENMTHVLELLENLPFQLIFIRHGYSTDNPSIKIISL